MRVKRLFLTVPIVAMSALAVSCGSSDKPEPTAVTPTQEPQNFTVAFSDRQRVESPDVSDANLEQLVAGNNEFALDLYRQLSDTDDGNLFMSPYSVSLALAMTYAGAAGGTAYEMADALKFQLSPDELHAAFNALDQELAARGADLEPDQKFTLEIANSIWGQQGFEFEQEFLDTLAENYGAGMRLVDYQNASEEARLAINGWVEDNTNDRIKDLIPQGAIDALTRLVLANAIYFKAAWLEEFDPELTKDGDFTLIDGSTVTARMMKKTELFKADEGDDYTAIEIPYVGGETSMVVIVPDDGAFEGFEEDLDADRIDFILGGLAPKNVTLEFPKFKFESKFQLPEPLQALGMVQAFDPLTADFSAMRTPPPGLVISDVIHQSFVEVNEQGTEAAAATAVIIRATSAPPPPVPFVVDRPFIFLIRDVPTDTILFMGRVLDPTAS